MPRLAFTAHLREILPDFPRDVPGATVREMLEAVFASHPVARSYLLDDQSALRKHVTIFVGERPVSDRISLADPVPPEAEVFVMQALSGG